MTELDLRPIRDALRHQHDDVLDRIEDVIVRALDRLAEEAVVCGADERHEFNTGAAAAEAIEKIAEALERAEANALRIAQGPRDA